MPFVDVLLDQGCVAMSSCGCVLVNASFCYLGATSREEMIMSLTSRRVVALLALLTSCLFLLAITILKQYILILWIIGTLVICLALVIAVREQNMGIRRVLLLVAGAILLLCIIVGVLLVFLFHH